MLDLKAGVRYYRRDGTLTGPLVRERDGDFYDPNTRYKYLATHQGRQTMATYAFADLIAAYGAAANTAEGELPDPPLHRFYFITGGIYRHRESGQLVRREANAHDTFIGGWRCVGNGALGIDGNVVYRANSQFEPERIDKPREAVQAPSQRFELKVGQTYETKNGSQVCVIAKHTDGEFEVTVLKGGHGYTAETRGHGPGSSYMVRPDGSLRNLFGSNTLVNENLRVVKLGKPFKTTDIIAQAIAVEIASQARN